MTRAVTRYLVVSVMALALPGFAQQTATSAANPAQPYSSSRASNDEVGQLRSEVASQNQTIQELKAMVQQLSQRLDEREAHVSPVTATQGAHVKTLAYDPDPLATMQTEAHAQAMVSSPQAEKPKAKGPALLKWTIGDTTVQIYGHSDVSYDYVDNGITSAMEATNPFIAVVPTIPVRANNGWLGQMSSNLSYFGIRGSRKINDYLTGVFQFETEVMIANTPGTTSDGACKFCLGSRDTYVGVSGPWGAIKLGKEDAPYKRTTTGAFDPFLNTIADARSIIGNSGGDNRGEFMGRVSHAIWYETPTYKGVYASILFSPGQNRSSDNSGYARGEPNCTGGNGVYTLSFINRGEGQEPLDFNQAYAAAVNAGVPELNPCQDGAWGNLLSFAATYRGYGAYLFGGYEHHAHVNRTTDLVGVADEAAWKLGAEYTIKASGTTPSFVFEHLKRYAATGVSDAIGQPVVYPTLNERTRPQAYWLAIRQKLTKKDTFNIDWIHAGKTPGDPGNCAPPTVVPGSGCAGPADFTPVNSINNSSNMYGIGLKHTLTNRMTAYFVAARQANHADAHYDLGAVGHGNVVDKKDWTGTGFPGTRIQGVSGGLTFDF